MVQRDVPADWAAHLAELSPTDNITSYLRLIWEPGYPWEPVNRWMVYQMHRAHTVDALIREQLQHPLPPSKMGNYYDSVLGEFVRNPDCLITERAYWLYRETGCWGRPFWVIQGAHGGHKRWFSPSEKKSLKLAGLPTDPAAPGDLPYADFDNRVIAQLRAHDLLRDEEGSLLRMRELSQGAMDARRENQERRFREQLVKWLHTQVADIAPDAHRSLVALDAPRSNADPREIEERQEIAEQNFIETGHTNGGRRLIHLL